MMNQDTIFRKMLLRRQHHKGTPVSWHFILPRQIFLPRFTAHVRINIASFSHAEQQYLMYLHYCKGRFRVGVGVDINKTQSNR